MATMPTFVNVGGFGGGGSPQVPSLPVGWQEHDLFVIFGKVGSAYTMTAPAGWTLFPSRPIDVPGRSERTYAWWRRATSSESAPSITHNDPDYGVAFMAAYRGVKRTGDPFDVCQTSLSTGSQPSTGMTISGSSTGSSDQRVLIINGCVGTTFPATDSVTNGNLSSIAERMDSGAPQSGITLSDGGKATAGAIGNTTISGVNAFGRYGYLISLLPEVPTGRSQGILIG